MSTASFSCGTQQQVGCTTLVVVSHVGVYTAHWWENISFAPDPEWRHKVRGRLETDEEVFDRTVTKPLNKGATKSGVVTHAAFPSEIEDEYVKAFLIHPDESSDSIPDGYRAQWNSIMNVVGQIVPRLEGRDRWTEVLYQPLDHEDPELVEGASGKILFKHDLSRDRSPAYCDGYHRVRLWVEGRQQPYHDDMWRPIEEK